MNLVKLIAGHLASAEGIDRAKSGRCRPTHRRRPIRLRRIWPSRPVGDRRQPRRQVRARAARSNLGRWRSPRLSLTPNLAQTRRSEPLETGATTRSAAGLGVDSIGTPVLSKPTGTPTERVFSPRRHLRMTRLRTRIVPIATKLSSSTSHSAADSDQGSGSRLGRGKTIFVSKLAFGGVVTVGSSIQVMARFAFLLGRRRSGSTEKLGRSWWAGPDQSRPRRRTSGETLGHARR